MLFLSVRGPYHNVPLFVYQIGVYCAAMHLSLTFCIAGKSLNNRMEHFKGLKRYYKAKVQAKNIRLKWRRWSKAKLSLESGINV